MNTSPYVYEALAASRQGDLRRSAAHGRLVRRLKAEARAARREARAARKATASGVLAPATPLPQATPEPTAEAPAPAA